MEKYILLSLIFSLLFLSNCSKDDNSSLENHQRIDQMEIHSTDYINGNIFTDTSRYDYVYAGEELTNIFKSGLNHITFKNLQKKVIAKIYYNNLEEIATIDSFFYDLQGRMAHFKRYNSLGWHIQDIELIYDSNLSNVTKVINKYYYPKSIIEEYTLVYSGLNIESAMYTTNNLNYTYTFEYYEDDNYQDLAFYFNVLGVYTTGIYGINVITLPIILSKNSIKSVRGYDHFGLPTFSYHFEHVLSNDHYSGLHFQWFDQHEELLNTTNIMFTYL